MVARPPRLACSVRLGRSLARSLTRLVVDRRRRRSLIRRDPSVRPSVRPSMKALTRPPLLRLPLSRPVFLPSYKRLTTWHRMAAAGAGGERAAFSARLDPP